jgi:hypothetical protein
MPQDIVKLRGMTGRVVEEVTITNASDFRNVSIRFKDKTALHFGFCTKLSIDSELVDWKTGNGRRIHEFPVVEGKHWLSKRRPLPRRLFHLQTNYAKTVCGVAFSLHCRNRMHPNRPEDAAS